jgi:energy-coupling factor transporter ATP-binding protein EcfA2
MINEETIRRWWQIFVEENGFTEVRILGKFQFSGYFQNVNNLIECIKPYAEMEEEQIYFVMNKIDEACYGRQQCEKIIKGPKQTTADNNITKRRWVLLDFDPKRPAGVNATNEEFELAHKKAQDVFTYLRDNGFHDPVICKSGNGWHCLLRCDMENTDYTRELISRFLQSIAIIFNDEHIDVDEAVFNAARICKLYGTTAKKGANLDDRPWRMSEIVYVPKEIQINDVSLFEKIADLLPKEEPKTPSQYNNGAPYGGEPFELESFLNKHAISYKKEVCSKWTKYVLDHCLFNPEHKGKDAAIIQMQSGAIKYTCLHNSCQHHTWQEVRMMYEPDAYDKKNNYQQQISQRPQKATFEKKPQIKEVIPELGDKWLTMSQIEDIDLSALPGFKTGFTELDRMIIKLYEGEITILSGNNASGKSSWLNTLILNVINQGEKCALWSGELKGAKLKAWIQTAAAGKANLKLSQYGDGKYFIPPMIRDQITSWMDDKFFLYNNKYGSKWEQIFHDMKILVKQGVKLFILDNLFSLDIDILEGDKNNKQKELILQLSDFVKEEGVHVILVAHPRKVMTFLRKNDICGTSDLQNAVDNIFIAHRVNQDFFRAGAEFFGKQYIESFHEFGNVIEVAKNRMWGVVDFMVGLHYEIESRRFKNKIDEEVEYGWKEEPHQVDMTFSQPSPQASRPMPTSHANVNDRNYGGESREIGDDSIPFAPPSMDDYSPF